MMPPLSPLASPSLRPARAGAFGMTIGTSKRLLGHKDESATQVYPPVLQRPGLGVRIPLDLVGSGPPGNSP